MVAASVLAASYQLPHGCLAGHAAVGELALDGRIRPVPGALAAAEGARGAGLTRVVCAAESGAEVALAGVEPVPVRHLAEAVSYFRGERDPRSRSPRPAGTPCCSAGRPGSGRRCWGGGCRASCRRSTTTRPSR